MPFLVLQSSWLGLESWLLCSACLPGVSWLLCGSSSQCHGFVCSLLLWYFLVILTIFSSVTCCYMYYSQITHTKHKAKSKSMPRIVQSSRHTHPLYVFYHSKTLFKSVEDPITNQVTQSFALRGLWLRHDWKCPWKNTLHIIKIYSKSLFFSAESTLFYPITAITFHKLIFSTLLISDVLVFSIVNKIRML